MQRLAMPLTAARSSRFCIALLRALDTRQTQAVLDAYLDLRSRADEVLASLEGHSSVICRTQKIQQAQDE